MITETPQSPWRADFPALRAADGSAFAYLDSAASAQKPRAVIDALSAVYERGYANVHRGLYRQAQDITAQFEAARRKVAAFIGAGAQGEIVFTRNATEAINLVAQSWGGANLRPGDEILLSALEHHANIVPWQLIAQKTGAVIKFIPLRADRHLDLEALPRLLSPRTKLLGLVHISNALGTVNPVREIMAQARASCPDIRILIDGTQSVVHGPVNMQELGADFFVFTGHKLYGPTGIGVLYGLRDVLASMPPYQGGGDMIESVSFEGSSFREPPHRFEAGTPPIAEAIGLGAAVDYLQAAGMQRLRAHEQSLHLDALRTLGAVEGIEIYTPREGAAAIISFNVAGADAGDVATILGQQGVAVRAGHHCCMPLMQALGLNGTVRASLGMYNDASDIEALARAILKAREMLL